MPLKLSTQIRSPGKAGGKISKIFKAAFKDAQPKIAALLVDRATVEANKTLKTLAVVYGEALNKPDSIKLTDEGIEIQLVSKIAQAVEGGAAAWDMKAEMLAKAKKFSKGGVPYIDIPFKHSTSGARGATKLPEPSAGGAMGSGQDTRQEVHASSAQGAQAHVWLHQEEADRPAQARTPGWARSPPPRSSWWTESIDVVLDGPSTLREQQRLCVVASRLQAGRHPEEGPQGSEA